MMKPVLLLLCLTLLQGVVESFPRGGPMSLCHDPYPHHSGIPRSEDPSPYEITLSAQEYNPGDSITVTISGGSVGIRGYQIGAHSVGGIWDRLYGEFTTFPQHSSAYSYFSTAPNCISHNANYTAVNKLEMTWKAPNVSVGDVIFSATLMKDFKTFWVNQSAELKAVQPAAAGAVVPPLVIGTSDFKPELNLAGCGTASGCITHPKDCTVSTCNFVVSYVPVADGIRFRLLSKRAEGLQSYVGIGISADQKMPNDETFICMDVAGSLDFAHGYNPGMHNTKVYSEDQVSDIVIESVDGALSCEFTRRFKGNFSYHGSKGKVIVHPVDYTTSLESPEYYIYVTWGAPYPGSKESAEKHKQLPVVSNTKIAFNKKTRNSFYNLHDIVKVHVTFMVVAWCGAVSIAMVIGRYFKDGFLNAKDVICGAKPWFQAHRYLAIFAALLTVIGFILIFVHIMGLANKQLLHTGFGITVMILTVIQVIMGRARPGGDAGKKRVIFNWAHRLTGILTYVLAAATMLIGTNITFLSDALKISGTGLIAAIFGIQALAVFILELRKCRSGSQSEEKYGASEGIEESDGKLAIEEPKDKNQSQTAPHTKSLAIFTIYIMLVLSLLTAFLVILWLEY